MQNKKGQFYFIATIIIIGFVISLAVIFNYSAVSNSYNIEKVAKEFRIEGEYVMDYDALNSPVKLRDFAKDYSSYIGEDKEIYLITAEGSTANAYQYVSGSETLMDGNVEIVSEDEQIKFTLEGEDYIFKLEKGKNFYFIIVYEKGGEKYVLLG